MGFFDDLGKKVTDAGQKTLQKTKEMSETVRINSLISEEEKKINNNYTQIGILFVDKYEKKCDEQFQKIVENIFESKQKICQYQTQIQNIKGVQRCDKCGAEVQRGSAFCNTCGAEMPKSKSVSINDMLQCTNCGAIVKKEMSFCTNCGNPMAQSHTNKEMDSITEEKELEKRICEKCGVQIEGNSVFCTVCGVKLEDDTNI